LDSITEWLKQFGMEQYAEVFAANDISPAASSGLTEHDLEALGVPLADRRLLQQRIAEWHQHADVHDGSRTSRRGIDSAPSDTGAERRQLTVLFCDLVGSTELYGRFDAEDMSDIYSAYRECCVNAVERCGGMVARYMGDGVLVYFGYPTASEYSAEMAVRAGLEIVEKLGPVRPKGARLEVRVGIATGLVVIGQPVGVGIAKEETVVGETLNLAARLQSVAEPGSVVISEETRRIIRSLFRCEDLGGVHLKGFPRPMPAWRVVSERSAKSRFGALHPARTRAPLVGRQADLEVLLNCWRKTVAGHGQVIQVSGEAGIGKSRLANELASIVTVEQGNRLLEIQCSPYHRSSSLFPVVRTLKRELATIVRTGCDAPAALTKLLSSLRDSAEAIPILGALLSVEIDQSGPTAALSPEALKKRTRDYLIAWLLMVARKNPVLVVVDDTHWIDPSTTDLLRHLIAQIGEHKVMLLLVSRGGFDTGTLGKSIERIELGPLPKGDVEGLIYHTAGRKLLPKEIVRQILGSTAGIPLFAEELTRTVVRSELVHDRGGHYEPGRWSPELEVPSTLQGILHFRLDQLGESRHTAQLGAVLGRSFSRNLLVTLWGGEDEHLDAHLMQLVREGVVQQSSIEDDVFTFRHALIHKAAYESLLKRKRKSYHRQAAQVLAAQPESVAYAQPELVAQHFTRADMHEHAVPLWSRAAEISLRRSANVEACAQADLGLSAIEKLGSPNRLREAELVLRSIKGTALIATRGWGVEEVGETFARAEAISEALDDTQHAPALWGLWVYHFIRGELARAQEYANRMLVIGREADNQTVLIEGCWTLGATLYWQAEVDASRQYLETAVALYDPTAHRQNAFAYGQDPGVSARAWLTFALTFCGRASEAVQCGQAALDLAKRVDHPFSTGWALAANTILRVELQDAAGTLKVGQKALRYCIEQEQAFWVAALQMCVGWAKARSGHTVEGIAMAEQGFQAYQATGAQLILSLFCVLLADCYLSAGKLEKAMAWVERGFQIAKANDEVPIVPSLLVVKGVVLAREGLLHAADAEATLRKALSLASEIGARLRQMQAAMALAQLLATRGDPEEACRTLRPVVDWFQSHGNSETAQPAAKLLQTLEKVA